MKNTIFILAAVLFFSCSNTEETENLFTGNYFLTSGNCRDNVFLEFNSGTFNTVFYNSNDCNSTQTTARGFTLIDDNIIKFNSSVETGYLRIVNNNNGTYTTCFSLNGSTDSNIIFEQNGNSECYVIRR